MKIQIFLSGTLLVVDREFEENAGEFVVILTPQEVYALKPHMNAFGSISIRVSTDNKPAAAEPCPSNSDGRHVYEHYVRSTGALECSCGAED